VTTTRLDSVLSRQHGLVTRAQARRAGLSDRQITRRMNDRRLIAVHRGVLRHSSFPVSHEERIRAALLALGAGAAVSHRTAAGLIGVSGTDVRFVEVTWPHASARRLDGVRVHGVPDLEPRWVHRVGGLPVTRPERTLIDLASVVHPWLVQRCMEEWLSTRRVTLARLEAAIAAHTRQGERASPCFAASSSSESCATSSPTHGSRRSSAKCCSPPACPDRRTTMSSTPAGSSPSSTGPTPRRWWPSSSTATGSTSGPSKPFEHDRDRQNEVEILGWHVVRFTARMVRDRPRHVAGQVRRILAAGGGIRDARRTPAVLTASRFSRRGG
jgi:hypothetical protein